MFDSLAGFMRGVRVELASYRRRERVRAVTRSIEAARSDEVAELLLNVAAFRVKIKMEYGVDLIEPMDSVCTAGVPLHVEECAARWAKEGDFLGANAASIWMFTLHAVGYDHTTKAEAKRMWAALRRGMDEIRRCPERAMSPLGLTALAIPSGFEL